MSWIRDSNFTCLQKLAVTVLRAGHIPRHVAFIMDGNRRYANRNNVGKAEGHKKGFDKLTEVLSWCLDLGVLEVTVFAFSIENFKRSEDEVSELMDLAKKKFQKLLEEEEKLMKEGVNIKVIGDLSKLPSDLYQLIAKAVFITKNNNKLRLTVAFSYTAQNEITNSVKCISKGIESKKLQISDITPYLLEKSLYTEDSETPELLIRTSGEIRLSDFMLWQSSTSYIYFTQVLWPEFTIWDLLKAIFHFQRSYDTLLEVKKKESNINNNIQVEKFLNELYQKRFDEIKAVLSL